MKGLTERIHLEQDEKVIRVMRKHWFILFSKVAGPIILLVLPFFVIPFLGTNPVIANLFGSVAEVGALVTFFVGLWSLLMWVSIWTAWTDFYLDIWTITNRRVIAINQRGLFHRHIASFRYERLQDVDIQIKGIIATFLDFGTLEAATAGHDDDNGGEFRFVGAPQPREVKAAILRAADERVSVSRAGASGLPSDGV